MNTGFYSPYFAILQRYVPLAVLTAPLKLCNY